MTRWECVVCCSPTVYSFIHSYNAGVTLSPLPLSAYGRSQYNDCRLSLSLGLRRSGLPEQTRPAREPAQVSSGNYRMSSTVNDDDESVDVDELNE